MTVSQNEVSSLSLRKWSVQTSRKGSKRRNLKGRKKSNIRQDDVFWRERTQTSKDKPLCHRALGRHAIGPRTSRKYKKVSSNLKKVEQKVKEGSACLFSFWGLFRVTRKLFCYKIMFSEVKRTKTKHKILLRRTKKFNGRTKKRMLCVFERKRALIFDRKTRIVYCFAFPSSIHVNLSPVVLVSSSPSIGAHQICQNLSQSDRYSIDHFKKVSAGNTRRQWASEREKKIERESCCWVCVGVNWSSCDQPFRPKWATWAELNAKTSCNSVLNFDF